MSSPAARQNVLLVDAQETIARFTPSLSALYRLNSTQHSSVAIEYIRRTSPALVITELDLGRESGLDVCRAAKAAATPSSVLVTCSHAEEVPEALIAGCDGVLLKPFSTNLLVTRIGRLLRDRSNQLRLRAARSMHKSVHLCERIDLLRTGTNQIWPNTHCPYCQRGGVVSFDYTSMRRAWYACIGCKKVWLARRQD